MSISSKVVAPRCLAYIEIKLLKQNRYKIDVLKSFNRKIVLFESKSVKILFNDIKKLSKKSSRVSRNLPHFIKYFSLYFRHMFYYRFGNQLCYTNKIFEV